MKSILRTALILFLILPSCDSESMMSPVTIAKIDMSQVNDGDWTGEYTDKKSGSMAQVMISVRDHRIIQIKVTDRKCTPIGKKGEYVIVQVIKEQSLQVDGISGATLTSTITLKAIENALKKGISHE
ncbi:MAG: FMN-binding protein [Bacteroidales bacterium]